MLTLTKIELERARTSVATSALLFESRLERWRVAAKGRHNTAEMLAVADRMAKIVENLRAIHAEMLEVYEEARSRGLIR